LEIRVTKETVNEQSLTSEEKQAFDQLLADYKAATHLVHGHYGGLTRKIAVALIRDGWRKQPPAVRRQI
jgi:hypothetical protein